MNKRELLVAATGASVCMLLSGGRALAQPSARARVLGILVNGGPSPAFETALKANIVDEFAKLGYIAGQNLVLEVRFAQDRAERFPDLVAELVRAKVDVILALGGLSAAAAAKVTTTTPIVYFIVTDPVALGLAASYDRPGGNLTGVTTLDPQQPSKQVAMLKEVLPRIERLAILSDPTLPGADERGWAPLDRALVEASRAHGLRAQVVKVKGPDPDLAGAFSQMVKEQADAILLPETPVALSHGKQIVELATGHRLLTMWAPSRVGAGGVLGYGTRNTEGLQRLPHIVDKVFKGGNPANLPVEVVHRYELIVNLKAARAIGATIPADVLKRADQVIE